MDLLIADAVSDEGSGTAVRMPVEAEVVEHHACGAEGYVPVVRLVQVVMQADERAGDLLRAVGLHHLPTERQPRAPVGLDEAAAVVHHRGVQHHLLHLLRTLEHTRDRAAPEMLLAALSKYRYGQTVRRLARVREIVEINREQGLTILLVEQNANLALEVSSYGYVLETGRILLEGPAAELRSNPQVKSAYLGG